MTVCKGATVLAPCAYAVCVATSSSENAPDHTGQALGQEGDSANILPTYSAQRGKRGRHYRYKLADQVVDGNGLAVGTGLLGSW